MVAMPTPRKPRSRKPIISSEIEKRIRQRAYELYEQRGRIGALDDWLQAESQILKAQKQVKAKAAKGSK